MTISFLPKDTADSYAIRALIQGEASEAQQKRAVKCIIEEICGTYSMTFDPKSERETSFNEGKRHVGRVLVGIANVNLGTIQEVEKKIEKRKVIVNTKGKPHG